MSSEPSVTRNETGGAAAGASGTRMTIWGAGGSAPTGRSDRARFGGDTVCFEFRRGDGVPLVIDLGSGARDLGNALVAEAKAAGRPAEVEVLLTHLHLDHVIGLPFFAPLYDSESRVTIRSSAYKTGEELERLLNVLAGPPLFPVRPLQNGSARFESFAC